MDLIARAMHSAAASGISAAKHAVTWVSHHTGLPVALVAAILLVVSWRIARKTARVAIEVAVALVIVVAATRLGLIRW